MSETPDATTPQPTPQPAAQPAPLQPAAVPLPPENLNRGTLFAAIIIPAGIAVWAIVSALGFISGWVAVLISIGALALYRKGSGGRVSTAGAIRTAAISLGTIIVAALAGPAIGQPLLFTRAIERGRFLEGILVWYSGFAGILVVVFAIVGIVLIFRTASQQNKEQAALEQQPPAPPVA